ncbi:MAG: UDP-N-acetylmuramoyl-L-alanyl-D-glutamate--2,6-diaminopimelate ligase [Actinobacteria bacterium]|uniref:Unannotated protein n=1 Tax=freshwater metagenome TaxID=449393 RepID=A0A6J5ZGM4_9ZZZZ|nr:UDP-N-acetylmuramoyl-L-alanyl-D-glutamate--2,6-diaminopimelate ligase [Actinomycetota bacterium]
MRLHELFDGLNQIVEDPEIVSLQLDSRAVTAGTMFCCVPGYERDGHDFAGDAIESGASALLTERPLGLGVPEIVVGNVREAMAPAAARLYGNPTAKLKMVGITGTNGKTTTAYLTRALLEGGGMRTGLLGSVHEIIGGHAKKSLRTTPEAVDLQQSFAEMVAAGDVACAMEVSSHAIRLHRVDAIDWNVKVFTNLTHEHLDFHGDMEDYFDAKASLFRSGGGAAIINVDDPFGRRLAEELGSATTVGVDSADADLRAEVVATDSRSTLFRVDGVEMRVPLPGPFNLLNAVCAVAAARQLGVDYEQMEQGLEHAEVAPGRFQPIDCDQEFAVIVDYAHTPDALDNALRTARGLADGRVILVFGAGGDRDASRRPLMGASAGAGADLVFLTSDNPRSEDPASIIEQIGSGFGEGGARMEVVIDRSQAIEEALREATAGDLVLIAGRGHERWQEIAGGEMIPFDDAAVAREALTRMTS